MIHLLVPHVDSCRNNVDPFFLGSVFFLRIGGRRSDLALRMARDRREGLEIKVVNPPTNNVSVQTSPATRRRRQRTSFAEFRPFKLWFPWLVPAIVVANIVLFVISMFINDCPKNSANCSARFLGRFAFQPMKENPLLGPSSPTWVT